MPIPLHEKYRPQTLSEVVGQPQAAKTVGALAQSGSIGGRAFWISGKTGTGKTTLAWILARYLADPFYVTESIGRRLKLSTLDQWASDARLYAIGKGGRAFIVNEAHGLSRPVIEQLLDWLEHLPSHVCVVFTTTRAGQESLFEDQIDAHPLLSRCHVIPLTTQGLAKAFAERARAIAQREGRNGKPLETYLKLANKHASNLRGMLTEIESDTILTP